MKIAIFLAAISIALFFVMGLAANSYGPRVASRFLERGERCTAVELNPGRIFARRANVQGISVGSMQMFEAMSRAIAASGIKPVLDKIFHFDEAQAAYRHMASGAHFGKIVIRVA